MIPQIIHAYKSLNFTDETILPQYVVLHCMCMDDEMAINYLCSKQAGVSSHYYIARNGDIYNLVDDTKKAWHAGKSCWKKQEELNQNSIGIELGNTGRLGKEHRYTNSQYKSLIALLKYLQKKFNIKPKDILAHSDIAPNRKTDPGAKFNWNKLIKENLAIDFSYKENFSISSIEDFGYNLNYGEKAVIKAFQKRFMPYHISGKLDDKTIQFIKTKKTSK